MAAIISDNVSILVKWLLIFSDNIYLCKMAAIIPDYIYFGKMAAIISDNIFLSKMSAAFRQCATIKSCPQGLEFRERERPEILVEYKCKKRIFW